MRICLRIINSPGAREPGLFLDSSADGQDNYTTVTRHRTIWRPIAIGWWPPFCFDKHGWWRMARYAYRGGPLASRLAWPRCNQEPVQNNECNRERRVNHYHRYLKEISGYTSLIARVHGKINRNTAAENHNDPASKSVYGTQAWSEPTGVRKRENIDNDWQ